MTSASGEQEANKKAMAIKIAMRPIGESPWKRCGTDSRFSPEVSHDCFGAHNRPGSDIAPYPRKVPEHDIRQAHYSPNQRATLRYAFIKPIAVMITRMRVAASAVVALLILNFVDEHFNDARYMRAMTSIFLRGQIIWLGNYEPGTNRYFSGFSPANA
jgi:hypothetical protein